MKVGDQFKKGKSEYTVVSVFSDSGNEFYIAKRLNRDGRFEYAHVFTLSNNGELYKHV